jgi:hypothetical protein
MTKIIKKAVAAPKKEEEVIIPQKQKFLARQLDLIPMEVLNREITIIGAGAIGSFTALSLAKIGFENITVIDFDEIDDANMNCQFYRIKDIGKPKVQALQEIIKDFTGVEITARNEKYESGIFNGILITAVDSMAVRKLIWDNHKEISLGTNLFIDPRMSIESALCYAMKPFSQDDIDSYEKTLYTDENAEAERCTNKSVMYTVLGISAHVAKIVKDFLTTGFYCRTMQWNIAKNAQQCYMNKK